MVKYVNTSSRLRANACRPKLYVVQKTKRRPQGRLLHMVIFCGNVTGSLVSIHLVENADDRLPGARGDVFAKSFFESSHELGAARYLEINDAGEFLPTVFEEGDDQVVRFFIFDTFEGVSTFERLEFVLASYHGGAGEAEFFREGSFNFLFHGGATFGTRVEYDVAARDDGANIFKSKLFKYLSQFFSAHIGIGGHNPTQ